MNKLKKIYPLIILLIFSLFVYFYYQKNIEDFQNIKKINLIVFFKIILLSLSYLITEGLILKNIVNSMNKKISLLETFFVMNFTYFCNTFVQFTGLGYRVYYLKKHKKLEVLKVLKLSVDTVACEVFIFSLIGILSLIFIDLSSIDIKISIMLYIIFLFLFIGSITYLYIGNYLIKKIKELFNHYKIYKIDKVFDFFLQDFVSKKKLYIKQFIVFILQFFILFLIFYIILKNFEIKNYLFLSLFTTSLVDFSFLLAITPYSVGVTEFITYLGTKDILLSFADIILLINIFRISMLLIYFIFGPAFFLFNMIVKKNGM